MATSDKYDFEMKQGVCSCGYKTQKMMTSSAAQMQLSEHMAMFHINQRVNMHIEDVDYDPQEC